MKTVRMTFDEWARNAIDDGEMRYGYLTVVDAARAAWNAALEEAAKKIETVYPPPRSKAGFAAVVRSLQDGDDEID